MVIYILIWQHARRHLPPNVYRQPRIFGVDYSSDISSVADGVALMHRLSEFEKPYGSANRRQQLDRAQHLSSVARTEVALVGFKCYAKSATVF